MSKINWKGKLECGNGDLKLISYDNHKAEVDLAGCMSYWVYMDTGEYVGAVLGDEFTVRNKLTNYEKAVLTAKDYRIERGGCDLTSLIKELNDLGLIKP